MTRRSLRLRAFAVTALAAVVSVGAATGGRSSIRSEDLREWLSYIGSDELEGRAVYSTGLGLAAAYIQNHLRAWGATPAGDNKSYLQTVRVLGVKSSNHSTLTVEVDGQRRTFTDGHGVTFRKNVGGKRKFTVDRVEFVGYGLDAPRSRHEDFTGRDVKGAAVVWLGPRGPKGLDPAPGDGALAGRSRYVIQQLNAVASIGPAPIAGPADRVPAGPADEGSGGTSADFTTVQRLDQPIAPIATAGDAFFEFLFSHAPTKYEELKRKADARDPLPRFRLASVTLTFTLDAEYQVVRTQLSQNVVAVVEGTDPQLKNTYVAFGAHYDHLGYAEGEVVNGQNGPIRLGAPGRVQDGAIDDRIWNGADDDGSGTVALLALARAFADGPRPKRSLLFVWHTGEERGLWGSRYFVDYPTVALDRIVAQLNIDMIGRNRDDKPTEGNTVYIVGSDRISTELDAINRAANADLPQPLTLDYEMNDRADPEQLYFRSDHYSYALKGIPIIFFTTGLHPDYHANTDEVSKIEFGKMTRIVQLVYETGARVANLDHAPVRDNNGPRAGKLARP
jgi:Peptidase family M28